MQELEIIVNTDFLRQYMKDNGELSESQFAELIGVTPSTVNRVFNGKRNPGNKFIAGVLSYCNGVNFDQVFSYSSVLPKGNENIT